MRRTITFRGTLARMTLTVGEDGKAYLAAAAVSPEELKNALAVVGAHLDVPLLGVPDEGPENGDDPVLFLTSPAAT